jgi:hypothetical protein
MCNAAKHFHTEASHLLGMFVVGTDLLCREGSDQRGQAIVHSFHRVGYHIVGRFSTIVVCRFVPIQFRYDRLYNVTTSIATTFHRP